MWWARREREKCGGRKGEGEVWWVRSVVGGREREKCGGRKGEGEVWWARREREKCGGRKGEGEVWWEEGRERSVVGGREREKCGGGEDECSSDTPLRCNSLPEQGGQHESISQDLS